MTDITELAQLRGRTVDYPYYLVECDCGKIYPSSELSGGEPMGDSGDYSDCYCPHCGEGEEHFAECADPETAWKAQQDKIDALVEALESEKRICATWRKTAEANSEKLEKAQAKADVYDMLRDDYGLREKGVGLADFVDWQANRIAELESRTVKLPPELYTIGDLIRTQDNRITDQPMFVVFQKREIIGSDEHSPSRVCWVWDGEEVSELRAKRLEALYQDGRDTRGYDRYAMQEVDEFVTACFTEHGCKDYLRQNGHNLRLPYIYACGSFRNNEYQLVRNWLAGIKVEAE
ncbi:phage EaA protein [Klebsiella pneumoniae]|nr:phage EaA protein [Klebsiella pneumoniae]